MSFVNWNGNLLPEQQVSVSPDNLSFRYGYGCFETIKVVNGKVINSRLHYGRLVSSLQKLSITIVPAFTQEHFSSEIVNLVEANNHSALARVRLTAYAEESDPSKDLHFRYIIQSWNGDPATNMFNDVGLTVDIYPNTKKTSDTFSSLKSNNYLPYFLAARWAKETNLDDAIILNTFGRIADGSKANIFLVYGDIIMTPPLHEACIDGTIRKYLINCLVEQGFRFMEAPLTPDHLSYADELFFTNAIYGITWIGKFRNKVYSNNTAQLLHKRFIAPLFT